MRSVRFSDLNDATPEVAKTLGTSVSCDWLNYVAQNKRVPSLDEVEKMIGVDLAIEGLQLEPGQKVALAIDLQRVWAQALVNQNDLIPLDNVNEASQSLGCSAAAG